MTLQYVDRVPTPEEHRRLAESVGWTHAFDWDAMPASLAGSVCGVTVTQDDELAPPKAFIGLFAAGESTAFYERHGFAAHRGMTGMFRVVPDGSTQP